MLRAILAAGLFLSAQLAFAHHGAGTFDLNKSVTFKADAKSWASSIIPSKARESGNDLRFVSSEDS
jgi:hypothetical protein